MNLRVSDNARVWWALVRRDLKILRANLRDKMIDTLLVLVLHVVQIAYLFPYLGMPHEMIPATYLGEIQLIMLFLGFTMSLKMVFDLKFGRFIDYHMTLPLPKRWLFASYLTSFVIETAIIGIPTTFLGIALLGSRFTTTNPHWLIFGVMYLLGLLFYGIFNLAFAFMYDYDWFMANAWQRRLNFLMMLGSLFFPLRAVQKFDPRVGKLFMLNPYTYIIEGMRSALLGTENYLSYWYCIPATCGFIALATWMLARGVQRRLDPV